MENIITKVDITISDIDDFMYGESIATFWFSSIESIKKASNNLGELIEPEVEILKLKDSFRYDEEVLNAKSSKNLPKIISNKLAAFMRFYDKMMNGKYTIDTLSIDKNNKDLECIKYAINTFKDRVNKIDLVFLNLEELTDIVNTIDIPSNVEIVTKYNFCDTCTKDELIELVNYLNCIKQYIDKFNLSPLEKCIFINDLVREKKYKYSEYDELIKPSISAEEVLEENEAESRSLFKILKSDAIVCVGFSYLYSAILELVGIKSDTISYTGRSGGHMANIVYLDDEKYGIKGVFEVDTTWGRKYNDDESYDYQSSIKNYYFFLRPLSDAINKKVKGGFDNAQSVINVLSSRINRLVRFMKPDVPSDIAAKELDLVIKSCEDIDKKLNGGYFTGVIEELENKREEIYNEELDENDMNSIFQYIHRRVYNSTLTHGSFEEALYNVKKLEHSLDKDKYPFNADYLNDAIVSKMEDDNISNLLSAIFGEDQTYKLDYKDSDRIEAEEKYNYNIIHNKGITKNPILNRKK